MEYHVIIKYDAFEDYILKTEKYRKYFNNNM